MMREFETGAVRDYKENDGWWLIPNAAFSKVFGLKSSTLAYLSRAVRAEEQARAEYLLLGLQHFQEEAGLDDIALMWEYARVLDEGQQKYGAFNWEKGIPFESYVSSAYRHYIKWRLNYDDENHVGSFIFNVIGAMTGTESDKETKEDG